MVHLQPPYPASARMRNCVSKEGEDFERSRAFLPCLFPWRSLLLTLTCDANHAEWSNFKYVVFGRLPLCDMLLVARIKDVVLFIGQEAIVIAALE